MIKEYRKVATIKAEQFDGSEEMMQRYHLYVFGKEEESCLIIHYCLKTLEGDLEVHLNDWIATGVNGEHWAIRDDIFRKTYQEVELKGIFYYADRYDRLVKLLDSCELPVDDDSLAAKILEVLDGND